MKVTLSNDGARIVSILVPDSKGKLDNVVIGGNDAYSGATIGRVANRIAKGQFTLDGIRYYLPCNQPPNHLHGGVHGFHDVEWDIIESSPTSITYRHLALESIDGYPGNLLTTVRFTLNENDELEIVYRATTDKTTVVNLTNHAYFNLSGSDSGTVADHKITLFADSFTPVDDSFIPTGDIRDVDGSPFDLRSSTPIGRHWDDADPQIQLAGGYDHHFVLKKSQDSSLELAARVVDPKSGRILEVVTTEPGVQFYTANSLPDVPRSAFCLETQHVPDSPNHPGFPSIRLEPGDTYNSTTIYRFLTESYSAP
jgi:aldose 1-epimerase